MRSTLTVMPDGTIVGLFTEAIDLSSLGRMTMRRASFVEFNEGRQVWTVEVPDVGEIFSHTSRQVCLDYEREWFAERV